MKRPSYVDLLTVNLLCHWQMANCLTCEGTKLQSWAFQNGGSYCSVLALYHHAFLFNFPCQSVNCITKKRVLTAMRQELIAHNFQRVHKLWPYCSLATELMSLLTGSYHASKLGQLLTQLSWFASVLAFSSPVTVNHQLAWKADINNITNFQRPAILGEPIDELCCFLTGPCLQGSVRGKVKEGPNKKYTGPLSFILSVILYLHYQKN